MDLVTKTAAGKMILEKTFRPNYEKWYKTICNMQSLCSLGPGCMLFKHLGSITDSLYITLPGGELAKRQWKSVKLLHNKDNTKSKAVECVSSGKWLVSGLTKDYLHNNVMFITFVIL